jgi:hypothetical protein
MSTRCYPANEVAKAIKAMGDTHQLSDFLCIARWFKAVPACVRANYRAKVEDCLMSLSDNGEAKLEIGVLDRVLRYCQVPMPDFDERRTTAILMAAHAHLGKDSALIGFIDLLPVIARYAEQAEY